MYKLEIMPFSSVPTESKGKINKAGKLLTNPGGHTVEEVASAIELVNTWRACHAYPINTFQSTLRTKLKAHHYSNYIVAQRLKRLPTIIDKLNRHPHMQLTTMQDIGGVRAILKSVKNVYRLRDEYDNSPHFKAMIINETDYIKNPRSEDGYRSLHLVFKYKNDLNPNYDGLKLEMQIRTTLQHAWATAVETMGTFTGQALKSRQGDAKWLEFFAITSAAFTFLEKCPAIPLYKHLSEIETFKKVAEKEAELGVLEKMAGFSIAADEIHRERGRGSSYYLVTLDSENKNVSIEPFERDSLEAALTAYSKKEGEATQGRKIEPVLVSSGSVESLKKAYPNFFLDTSQFAETLNVILARSKGK
jgi:putative GTP pyrophosphokinase